MCPPSASDRRFFFLCACVLETGDDARRKVIKRTGVKWRLKFQWQSGSNSPELSPHTSCNLADISRLRPTKTHFAYVRRLGFIDAFKFTDGLFINTKISLVQAAEAHFTYLNAHNKGDYISNSSQHGYLIQSPIFLSLPPM